MTKKDYELIADHISTCIEDGVNYDTQTLTQLTDGLAELLERDNPRFDRNKFLQACGIETGGWVEHKREPNQVTSYTD